MHISFYLLVPLISLSIMLVTPHLNFHSNAVAMVDGSPPPEGNGFYNNYENAGSPPPPPEGNGFYNNYENAGSPPPPAEGNGFYNNYEDGEINSKYPINTNEFEGFYNDKLIVKVKIDLQNLERVGFLRISSLLNGEEIIKDVPLSEIDRSIPTITIDLVVNKKNDIVEASDKDEYHVCAYHIRDLMQEYDSFTNFDCNEGDLQSVDMPNYITLFQPSSQVYLKSQNYHYNALYQASQFYNDYGYGRSSGMEIDGDKVIITIYSPMEDRMDTKKLKIMAMIKGQIQSEVIDDVQEELENIGSTNISRTFIFDRNTDIGLIQIGDKFLACVASDDLRPPEGQECEKRILKKFDQPNVLYAR